MFDDFDDALFDANGDGELDSLEETFDSTYNEYFDEQCDRELGLIYEGTDRYEDDDEEDI